MFKHSCWTVLFLFRVSATAVQLMCTWQFNKKKTAGWKPCTCFFFLRTVQRKISSACSSLQSAVCVLCLFASNKSAPTLEALQLFEHDSGQMYRSPVKPRGESSTAHHLLLCPVAVYILFSINLLCELWLIELPFVSRVAWQFSIIFGGFTGSLMYSDPTLNKETRDR